MKVLKPKVDSIITLVDVGDGFILLEDYRKYVPGTSNLYKVDNDFQTTWTASPVDGFYRGIGIREGILTVFDDSGYAVLDAKSGEVGEWAFSRWE